VIAVALLDLISLPVTVKSPLTVVSSAVIAIVPLVPFDMVSLLPKVRSLPVTFKSPLNSVNVDVTVTLPLEGFVI